MTRKTKTGLIVAFIAGLTVYVLIRLFVGIQGQFDLDDKIKDCERAGGAWLADGSGHDCYDVQKLEGYR